MDNCSPYLKTKRQNSRGRYKRVKQIFQTGKHLTTTKPHGNDELKNFIGSFPDKNNAFQWQTVSYEDIEQYLRLLRNDCSKGYDNIPAMFIEPVIKF